MHMAGHQLQVWAWIHTFYWPISGIKKIVCVWEKSQERGRVRGKGTSRCKGPACTQWEAEARKVELNKPAERWERSWSWQVWRMTCGWQRNWKTSSRYNPSRWGLSFPCDKTGNWGLGMMKSLFKISDWKLGLGFRAGPTRQTLDSLCSPELYLPSYFHSSLSRRTGVNRQMESVCGAFILSVQLGVCERESLNHQVLSRLTHKVPLLELTPTTGTQPSTILLCVSLTELQASPWHLWGTHYPSWLCLFPREKTVPVRYTMNMVSRGHHSSHDLHP